MNALSLAYSNAQKQHKEPSWIDDPFDLKGFAKGVIPLSHQRSLEDYAIELVSSYGEFINNQYELDLEKLSSSYQLELVRLYIESIDREIEWACYGEDQSINSDFLCAMLAMLQDSNPKTRANFAQVTTLNLIAYYKEVLQNVLDTACHDLHCNEMNDAGYHREPDSEHGDYVWIR
jgi:hypothetical protein